uniref:Uncharacterized protein n=1 Tax=Anguilla anguilla TaxID=7936 RepID=A0A0E9UC88_ANGAN
MNMICMEEVSHVTGFRKVKPFLIVSQKS